MASPSPKRSILLINPNTTQTMTEALKPLIDKLNLRETRISYFTAPSGVASINNTSDGEVSATACLPSLRKILPNYDAFLVCCYSPHPLVSQLRSELNQLNLDYKPVAGIFEASISTCLPSLNIDEKFGIVSTGSQWSAILSSAVADFLGSESSARYAGTETTGLNANELHSTSTVDVEMRMKDATKRLLAKGVGAVCLGCAGMAGLEGTVREACIEVLGEREGRRVRIVDGVVSGILFLEGALRAGL